MVGKAERCLKGTLAVLAFITDPAVVLKILAHLRLPTEVPLTAPAWTNPQLERWKSSSSLPFTPKVSLSWISCSTRQGSSHTHRS